jgi:hypothetical protein
LRDFQVTSFDRYMAERDVAERDVVQKNTQRMVQ